MREHGLQLNEDGSEWEKIENGEATKTIDFPNEKPLSDANTFSFILIVLSFLSIIIAPNAESMFFCFASPILLIIAFAFMLVGNKGKNGYTIVFFIVVGMMYWIVVYLVLGDIGGYGGGGVLVVYQNGAGPSLIVSGLNQRVYPKPIAQVKNK